MSRYFKNERVQDFFRGLILALVNVVCIFAMLRVMCG